MLFFGFLFQRYDPAALGLEAGQRDLAYLDFLAPGVSIMTVLFGASQSGIGWIRDLQTGFLPRMVLSPAGPVAILVGKLLADVVRLVGQAGIVLLLGILLGARLDIMVLALPAAVLALLLFATGLSALSCTIALRAQAQEAMAAFVHMVNMPLLFTSTALVPDKHMPDWLAGVSAWNPLTLTVDAWRGTLLLGHSPSLFDELLPLLVFACFACGAAVVAMKQVARV